MAATSAPDAIPAPPVQFAGCIINAKARCGCFDTAGVAVEVKPEICMTHTNAGGSKPLEFPDDPVPRHIDAREADALRFAFGPRI